MKQMLQFCEFKLTMYYLQFALYPWQMYIFWYNEAFFYQSISSKHLQHRNFCTILYVAGLRGSVVGYISQNEHFFFFFLHYTYFAEVLKINTLSNKKFTTRSLTTYSVRNTTCFSVHKKRKVLADLPSVGELTFS